jgi:hypothetical protein
LTTLMAVFAVSPITSSRAPGLHHLGKKERERTKTVGGDACGKTCMRIIDRRCCGVTPSHHRSIHMYCGTAASYGSICDKLTLSLPTTMTPNRPTHSSIDRHGCSSFFKFKCY